MKNKIDFPPSIAREVKGKEYTADTIGKSGAEVLLYDHAVLKIGDCAGEIKREYEMLLWLSEKFPVPRVLCWAEQEGKGYLLMSRLRGKMACSREYLENSEELTYMLAEALQMLWSVPAEGCPYVNTAEEKLAQAEQRVKMGLCDIQDTEPGTFGVNGFAGPAELLEWLKAHKPQEKLVLSHGDFCLPNLFFAGKHFEGFIDVGRSGLADPYQDIALCWRSLRDNAAGRWGGPVYSFEDTLLFSALHITPDFETLQYYILLDELF